MTSHPRSRTFHLERGALPSSRVTRNCNQEIPRTKNTTSATGLTKKTPNHQSCLCRLVSSSLLTIHIIKSLHLLQNLATFGTMTMKNTMALFLTALTACLLLFAPSIQGWTLPPAGTSLASKRSIGNLIRPPSHSPSWTTTTTSLLAASNNATETSNEPNDDEPSSSLPKKGGYVRVEEWDAQRKASPSLEWDEKVKFDGHRNGNRWQQNEILRQNLFR